MKRASLFFLIFSLFFICAYNSNDGFCKDRIKLKLFYSSHCKSCIDIKENFLPGIASKYKDNIEIEYMNLADKENFKLYLATEEKFNVKAKVPSILIGNNLLVGNPQIKDNLQKILNMHIQGMAPMEIQINKPDLIGKFRSFSFFAVIFAGLIDGVNPCAFTVLIFFISFLTLMGYKKKDLATIGITFISAVFLTYLAIGLGLFRGLYELKHFYAFIKITYYVIAIFCFALAYLNLKDFFEYKKTKSPDSLKVKLPKAVRARINSIITMFYRKDSKEKAPAKLNLIGTALIVGFLVSLLEAVCTGQVYLPTIVFILKEPNLRIRALFYLLLYNFMFIAPLLLILLVVMFGMSSKKLEEFFRNKIALVKLFMFILFLGLGIFLIIGV